MAYVMQAKIGRASLASRIVTRGWDGRMLAGRGTGAPPSALEGRIGRLDPIVSYCCSGQTGFYALGRWLVTDYKGHTDGLDGTLLGRGWDGQTLAGAGTGAPPLATEQERHHWLLSGGGRREAVAVANCLGAARGMEYFFRAAK